MPRRRTGPRIVTRSNKRNYLIRFIDTDGRQKEVSTGTENRSEAEEVLEEFLRERRGVGRPSEHRRTYIADLLADYGEYQIDTPAAAERTAYAMTHLLKFWGERTVDHVNRETIKKYVASAARSQSTVRRELSTLRAAINHGVAMNRMMPFGKIELPAESNPRTRWLTKNEAAQLLWEARRDYRSKYNLQLFIIVGLYTGARRGAIMELEWSQIDFDNRTLDFNKLGTLKTNKRRARIPMGRKLHGHLYRRWQNAGGTSTHVFHQKTKPAKRVLSVVKGFKKACTRARFHDVVQHTLRHTCASWMAQRGEKMIDASNYLNMSMETLSRIYAHHHPEHIKDLADRF